MESRKVAAAYLRNFVFGVEDSLVSTVGLLSGIAAAGAERRTILITGAVLIFVEAFSMAIGSFLSEQSADEYEESAPAPMRNSIVDGGIMFFSYIIAGLVPLGPYMFMSFDIAFPASIAASIGALFVLGYISGRISKTKPMFSAMRMAVIGAIAISVGIFVGGLVENISWGS